jgi:hypothetical protein
MQYHNKEHFHSKIEYLPGGASWFPITTGLSDQEFYKIVVDKYEPDILYLATQSEGVFISQNGGDLWESWNDGLTNVIAGTNGNNVTNTMTLTADGRYLFFGSSSSGVFRRKLDTFSGSFIYLPLVLKNGK